MELHEQIRRELIERYEETGRDGFNKPKSLDEALQLIDTISRLYENDKEPENIVISLSDITEKLRTFFDNY